MAITEAKTLTRRMMTLSDAGKSASGNVITTDVFSILGMLGQKVMAIATVQTQIDGKSDTNAVYPVAQFSYDGTNFVDSPHTISETFAASTNSVAKNKTLIYFIDLTDILALYVRFVWKAKKSDGTGKDIDAGKIQTSITYTV